jgi:hypothetical protein
LAPQEAAFPEALRVERRRAAELAAPPALAPVPVAWE